MFRPVTNLRWDGTDGEYGEVCFVFTVTAVDLNSSKVFGAFLEPTVQNDGIIPVEEAVVDFGCFRLRSNAGRNNLRNMRTTPLCILYDGFDEDASVCGRTHSSASILYKLDTDLICQLE